MSSTTIIILCTVLAITKGDVVNVITSSYNSNVIAQNDNYISINRVQYAKILGDYDKTLTTYRRSYVENLGGITTQLDMITASLVQMEERLNPMEVINYFSKQCISKYRASIPTVLTIKTGITRCYDEANNQINNLVSSPLTTRNNLDNYYKNYFEKEIANCAKNYDNASTNYTNCITNVIGITNANVIINQKAFNVQIDAAECTGKAYIKRALDCSYTIQTNAISKIAEASVLINNCLAGKDECKPCNETQLCTESYELQVDYKNKTILNPFYGRETHSDSRDIILLMNLHQFLLSPKSCGGKNSRKFTIEDALGAFAVFGKSNEEIEDKLRHMSTKKQFLQPRILIVGDIQMIREIFVYVDGVRFKTMYIIHALDICFKIFFVFNLKYPEEANFFWVFIEQFFYKLNNSKSNIKVSTLCNELNL